MNLYITNEYTFRGVFESVSAGMGRRGEDDFTIFAPEALKLRNVRYALLKTMLKTGG